MTLEPLHSMMPLTEPMVEQSEEGMPEAQNATAESVGCLPLRAQLASGGAQLRCQPHPRPGIWPVTSVSFSESEPSQGSFCAPPPPPLFFLGPLFFCLSLGLFLMTLADSLLHQAVLCCPCMLYRLTHGPLW